MRAVVDTNVLVSAFRSAAGAARPIVEAALERRFDLLASVPLFLEYEAVLMRPEQLRAFGLNAREMQEFLAGLATTISPVEIFFLWRPQLADPADEMVLEAAVNGRAERIVTNNRKTFATAARKFSVGVSSPGEFLKILEGS